MGDLTGDSELKLGELLIHCGMVWPDPIQECLCHKAALADILVVPP